MIARFFVISFTILYLLTLASTEDVTKVIIEKSRGEVSLMGQDAIENVT